MTQDGKHFNVVLTAAHRDRLEAYRWTHRLKSQAEALRHMLDSAVEVHDWGEGFSASIGDTLHVVANERGEPGKNVVVKAQPQRFSRTTPFRGVTASGEPLPERKPYQKTGKK